jgi:hypothetical protein
MGEVLRFRAELCERSRPLHLSEVLEKLGIELLDNRLTVCAEAAG